MHSPHTFRCLSAIAGLMLTLTPAAAAPTVPAACDVVKEARLEKIIGPDADYIPMIDQHDDTAAMSMCAYETKGGHHYGFSIRRVENVPEDQTSTRMLNKAIETLMRANKSAKGLSQPNIGEAALWNARAQQLTVWLDNGKTTLLFLGDQTTPDLSTHLRIARQVIRHLH